MHNIHLKQNLSPKLLKITRKKSINLSNDKFVNKQKSLKSKLSDIENNKIKYRLQRRLQPLQQAGPAGLLSRPLRSFYK